MNPSPPPFDFRGLTLRPILAEDAAPWLSYLVLPEVNRLTSWDVATLDDMRPVMARLLDPASDDSVRLALAKRGSGELVGTVGFHGIVPKNRAAEIAYDLAPRYWGKGVISEACRVVTEWGFDRLGFNRIQATVMVGNAASARVLDKCGFALEGTLRQYRIARGLSCDYWMYSKLRQDAGSAGVPALRLS
jgi:[ribosomal protein S5]-alanine N-acetyltransferase